jgi:hypothetical protein
VAADKLTFLNLPSTYGISYILSVRSSFSVARSLHHDSSLQQLVVFHSIQWLFINSQEVLSRSIKQTAVHGGLRVQTALRLTVWRDIKFGYFSPYSDSLWAGRSGDRIPVEARFFAPINTGRRAHPASSTMGTGSLSQRLKQLARGFDQPTRSSAEVKETVELYLYFPSGSSWPLLR